MTADPIFSTPPVTLTIAGSDSSAGAGIQADLKTFTAHGVYGLTAVTCIVSELPGKVSRIFPCPADMVRDQLETLLQGFPVAAIKTGMLYSREIIAVVAEVLGQIPPAQRPPLVVDPVMTATSGDPLLQADAVAAYESLLFPIATLLTPNLDEASALLGRKISQLTELEHAAAELAMRHGCAVIIKGGHLHDAPGCDVLFEKNVISAFKGPYIRNVTTHGTGCTYSAAITAGLAKGLPLSAAIGIAKDYITNTISFSHQWGMVQALNHSAPRLAC
jgi:hydroxymethylpyrimidine/phosphomethylpyrimidine kinase